MTARTPVTNAAINETAPRATRGMLHLTNGTAVVDRLREADVKGVLLPWDDVLHEGPVPAGLGPAALREVRAQFLASCGWGPRDRIARDLADRDAILDAAWQPPLRPTSLTGPRFDEIVLWFEHDLYDQLQLVQILDRVPVDEPALGPSDGQPRLTMVPAPTYLGSLPASRYPEFFAARREVSSAEHLAARDGWGAFRSPDPRAIVDALPRVTALPHLPAALIRHLQQFPSVSNGLSRTEQQALDVVAQGVTRVGDVYTQSHHDREEAVFMGDSAFLIHLKALVRSSRPLLEVIGRELTLDAHLALTTDGAAILAGQADRVALCGIDRWVGGVHVSGHGAVWRWDHDRQTVRFV